MDGLIPEGWVLSRTGTPHQIMIRKHLLGEAVEEVELFIASLVEIDHCLWVFDKQAITWNPKIALMKNSILRKIVKQEKICNAKVFKIFVNSTHSVEWTEIYQHLEAFMRLYKFTYANKDKELLIFLDNVRNKIENHLDKIYRNLRHIVEEYWDSIVETVWDNGGHMSYLNELNTARHNGFQYWKINFPILDWLCAIDVPQNRRDLVRKFRIQALSLYGVFVQTLLEKKFTKLIDSQQSIGRALMEKFNFSKKTLKSLVKHQSLDGILLANPQGLPEEKFLIQFPHILACLREWKVGEAQWPQGYTDWCLYTGVEWYRPDVKFVIAPQSLSIKIFHFVRPDYLMALYRHYGNHQDSLNFLYQYMIDPAQASKKLDANKVSLSLVGNRKPNGFVERMNRLHTRLYYLNALVREMSGYQVKWLGLCPAWLDEETGLLFQPLTTSGELAEEGVVMRHCVGGYDQACIEGSSYIFGIRLGQERIATMEIQDLDVNLPSWRELHTLEKRLTINQIKEFSNRTAQSEVQRASQRFMTELKSGKIENTLSIPRVQEKRKGLISPTDMAIALFPEITRVLMPEWKDRSWKE